MIYKRVFLKEVYPILENSEAYLDVFVVDSNDEYGINYTRPSMLVVPGGAYLFVSFREKEQVACKFVSEGFNAFTLTYSVNKKYPLPQLEVACALDYIRNHKEEFHSTGEILLTGFSAGGHLVASYSLKYKELEEITNFKNVKPDCIFLGYPVINLSISTHGDSARVISGGDEKLKEELSVDTNLDSTYPPVYIWTTDKDTCVSIIQSLNMVEALKRNGVKYRFDLFKNKDHGYSISSRDTRMNYLPLDEDEKEIARWVDHAIDFYATEVRK